MKYRDWIFKITKLLIFSLILSFSFIQLTYIYRGALSHTRANMSGYYAERKNSLDVVILGTSSTFSAFMPMEIWGKHGITSYNMCTNVLFEDSMKYYVREVSRTQNPELLIIDTAPFLYGHNSAMYADDDIHLRYNTDGMSISWNRVNLINDIVPKEKRIEFYLDLFYYHGNTEPSKKYLFNKCVNVKKGYNNLPQMVSYDENDYVVNTSILQLPEVNNNYFIDLLEELKNFKGNVLFVEQPIFYTQELEIICSYSEYMESKVKEYGYDYLDLSKKRNDINLDSQTDYSVDYLHFTANSAEKITNYLAEYIDENYVFSDHRKDIDYQQWQEQYMQWKDIKMSEKEETDHQIKERIAKASEQ